SGPRRTGESQRERRASSALGQRRTGKRRSRRLSGRGGAGMRRSNGMACSPLSRAASRAQRRPMARQGVWSVGTVEITGDAGERGVAVLVVDEEEGGLIANDLWPETTEGEAMQSSLTQLFGELGRPRKIVVKTGALAKALRASGMREEIAVGATPQLDATMEALERDVAELANLPGPLDGEGATSAHVNAFYVAADAMRQVAPWGFLPPSTGFAVEAPALGIEEGGAFVLSNEDDLDGEE